MGNVSVEVKTRYNAKTYDHVQFRVRKDWGGRERVQRLADARGQSLASMFISLIEQAERESGFAGGDRQEMRERSGSYEQP